MPNCANCHNLLPGTVDRCPVCGAETTWQHADQGGDVDTAPAWRPAPTSEAPAAADDTGLSPDAFLAEFLGDDGAPAATSAFPSEPAAAAAPEPVTPARPSYDTDDPFAAGAVMPPARAWDTPAATPDPAPVDSAPPARAWDTPAPTEPQPPARAWDTPAPAQPVDSQAPAWETAAWEASGSDEVPAPGAAFEQPAASFDAPAQPYDAPEPAPAPEPATPSSLDAGGLFDPAALFQTDSGPDGPPPPPVSGPPMDLTPPAPAPPAPHGSVPVALEPSFDPAGHPAAEPLADPIEFQVDSFDPRQILGPSGRIEGDIKRGPSRRHGLIVAAGALASVATIGAGLLLGWTAAGPDTLVATATESIEDPLASADETEDGAGEGPGADGTDDDAGADPEPPAVEFPAEAVEGVVTVRLDDCGLRGSTIGVVVDADIVLTLRSETLTDSTPTIVLADGSTVAGEVLGRSRVDDLAVIRLERPIVGALVWGSAGGLRTDTVVSVLRSAAPPPTWAEAAVTDYDRSTGLVTEIEFDDQFREGAPLRNDEGHLVGLIDQSGDSARTSQVLRPRMVQIMNEPDFPASECPVPVTTPDESTEGEGGETDEGADTRGN